MTKQLFQHYRDSYKQMLFNNVIPFWENNSIDKKYGGYFTCLDRDGSVYDTDKFIWLQARQVWTFSMLYNRYEKKEEWLNIAKHGIDFLKKYGRADNGYWYFSLRQDGKPLVQPYNIFSDCFAALAFGEFALATGDKEAKQIALDTYNNILYRQDNPKGKYNKLLTENRPLKSFSLPMILANITLELKWLLGEDTFKQDSVTFIDEIMNFFLDKEKRIIRENVLPDGSFLDSFDGRLINPGHGIEGMGFVMDVANELGDTKTIKEAVEVILSTLEFSWDKQYGGLFYFLDLLNKPPLALEWNQKLWWVHLETLVALSTAYTLTGDKRCWDWFEKVHKYTWAHFPDKKFDEWFGYLDRQGKPLLYIKGGKWKGFFHVPRSLFRIYNTFNNLSL